MNRPGNAESDYAARARERVREREARGEPPPTDLDNLAVMLRLNRLLEKRYALAREEAALGGEHMSEKEVGQAFRTIQKMMAEMMSVTAGRIRDQAVLRSQAPLLVPHRTHDRTRRRSSTRSRRTSGRDPPDPPLETELQVVQQALVVLIADARASLTERSYPVFIEILAEIVAREAARCSSWQVES